jgi:hypothetical protein
VTAKRRGAGASGGCSPSGDDVHLAIPFVRYVPCTRSGFLESHSTCWERWRGDEPHGRTSASSAIRVDHRANGSSSECRSLRESERPGEETTRPTSRSGAATGGKTSRSMFEGRRRSCQSRQRLPFVVPYSEGRHNLREGSR